MKRKHLVYPKKFHLSTAIKYSCQGNPMDRGTWAGYRPWSHKSQTRLRDYTTTTTQL